MDTPQSAGQPGEPTAGRAKKILLVEDDDYLADVYKTRLEAEGFDVSWVPDGEQALDAAIKYQPDLVLLDIMMPKINGLHVLDSLRNTPQTAKVKIVMVTALSQAANQELAKAQGADDYLVKSQVMISDVIERIKKQLEL
jgi:DNA-binding response OmpR family regulator